MPQKNLSVSLLALRASVFLVMFMWTIDKIINPAHAAKVFEKFYFISGVATEAFYVIAALELLLLFSFLAGFKKSFSYAAVLAIHGVSTLSSFKQYFAPFDGANLLFFAAWPMLAACLCLYLMREQDTLLTIKGNA